MDLGDIIYLYVCRGIHQLILERIFGVTRLQDVDETMTDLPEKETEESERLRLFISWLNGFKPYTAPIQIIRLVTGIVVSGNAVECKTHGTLWDLTLDSVSQ